VAAIDSDVTAVAADATDIGTVAGNIANVNTVAGISANVTTVAGIDANVTTVAGISADVTAVAGNNTNVSTVAGISADVSTVAGISTDVTTVATNVADITNFADVYQGPKATDPATRNDSSALQAGDLYFNTVDDVMKIYDGAAWLTAFVPSSGFVTLTDAQTITGVKTFTQTIVGSVDGTAANVTGTVAVANGGTGATTLTANNVLLGNGTSAVQAVAPGTSGNVLTSNGTTWQSTAPPSVTIASTAEAEAGTNNTNFITPLRMREGFNASGSAPVYACRAWVNFDGTTSPGTIRGSGNVSSVTRNATGNYTVNFTTAMPDASYATNATAGERSSFDQNRGTTASLQTTTSVRIGVFRVDTLALINTSEIGVSIFR
jgi:hypothetical protein